MLDEGRGLDHRDSRVSATIKIVALNNRLCVD